jgi:hypothetical protein
VCRLQAAAQSCVSYTFIIAMQMIKFPATAFMRVNK